MRPHRCTTAISPHLTNDYAASLGKLIINFYALATAMIRNPMASYTYTDQIVLALSRHGTLNVSQLATKISHDHGKTKHIVNLMASNNKIQKAGAMDGEPSYQLTGLGRTLADRLHGSESQPSQVARTAPARSLERKPEPKPRLAPTPASSAKPGPVPPAKPPVEQIPAGLTPSNTFGSELNTRKFQAEDIARVFSVPPHMIGHSEKLTSSGSGVDQAHVDASECRFGILNSGQLILLPQRVGPIVLSTADVEQLRRMLEATA